MVQIGIEDYFEDPNSPEARKLFDEMVNKLQVTAPVTHFPDWWEYSSLQTTISMKSLRYDIIWLEMNEEKWLIFPQNHNQALLFITVTNYISI